MDPAEGCTLRKGQEMICVSFRKEARLYDKADADPSALVDRIDAAIAACADGQTEEVK